MKRVSQNVLLAISAIVCAGIGHAAVIDFSSAPGIFTSYTVQGVTFTPAGAGNILGVTSPNGTRGIIGNGIPIPELRADIAGGATSVAVDLGDFGGLSALSNSGDDDLLFLEIFDSANTLLGSVTFLSNDGTMHNLSLSNPNIAYAVFGARAPANSGSSVFADNFSFTAPAAVPEPSSVALFGLALAGLLGVARRK